VFTPRGWLANDSSDYNAGYIDLEVVNKRALLRGVDERARLRIARSGFIRLELSDASELPATQVGTASQSTGNSP